MSLFNNPEFVLACWDSAQENYEAVHEELWCNLTREEQIELYCEEVGKKMGESKYV